MPIETRKLGRSGAVLTKLGLGCAPLGDLFTCISDEQALQIQQVAWDSGVRYYDTAPITTPTPFSWQRGNSSSRTSWSSRV